MIFISRIKIIILFLKIGAHIEVNAVIYKLFKKVYKPKAHLSWTGSIIDGKEYKIEVPYKSTEFINFNELMSNKSIFILI